MIFREISQLKASFYQDKSTKKSVDIKITKKQPKRKQFKKNKLQY